MAGTTPEFDRTDGDRVADNGMNAEGENNAAMTSAAPTTSYQTISCIDSYADDFVDIDSDKLNLTIATNDGEVLAGFQGAVHCLGGIAQFSSTLKPMGTGRAASTPLLHPPALIRPGVQ